MSWVTEGAKGLNKEFHSWNEKNLKEALRWAEDYLEKGYTVVIYNVPETQSRPKG
jgi:hypothetical protein